MMLPIKVAFAGASATGKTVLAEYAASLLGCQINPVGSRSVAKSMGFSSPYDVDKNGVRAEFQRKLLVHKKIWEDRKESFITDRTHFDNLVYTMMHASESIDMDFLEYAKRANAVYTHIFFVSFSEDGMFCEPGSDPARIQNLTYHKLFSIALEAILAKFTEPHQTIVTIKSVDLAERKGIVARTLCKTNNLQTYDTRELNEPTIAHHSGMSQSDT